MSAPKERGQQAVVYLFSEENVDVIEAVPTSVDGWLIAWCKKATSGRCALRILIVVGTKVWRDRGTKEVLGTLRP